MTESFLNGSLSPGTRMEALLAGIVTGLIDRPERMQIRREETDGATTLHLSVAPEDLGKVIGKQGRTARSIRTLLGAFGSKLNHRFNLNVTEDDASGEV